MIGYLSAASAGTKLLVLAVVASFVFGGGLAAGLKWQAGEVADAERAQEKAEQDRDGWKDAAGKWEAAIKAQNSENAKAREVAEKQRRKMDAAVSAANAAAERFIERKKQVDEQAKRDREACAAERVRVCGTPLR